MIPSILLRKFGICVSLIAALGLATFANTASAQANGAQTFTQVDKNVVQVMPGRVNPCTGDAGTLTVTFNDIFHVTTRETGSSLTGTMTGSALFVPDDPSRPTYTGEFVNWFDDADNLQSDVEHFTSEIEALGSDGSHLKFHWNGGATLNANGVTVGFNNLFCG